MTIDIASIKANADLVQVIGLQVELKSTSNGEFSGLCPFHGESTPSFTVNPVKGFFHCFGCGKHGDVFDYLRERDGMTLTQAAEYLNGAPIPRDRNTPTRPPVKRQEWRHQLPPADQVEPQSFRTQMGEPVAKWPYRDAQRNIIGYVCRYQDGDKKVPLTWTYGSEGDEPPEWRIKGFSAPRPLFGLDRIAMRPDDPVIIGEGEKTVAAMHRLFPGHVAVGWPGGTNGLQKVDLAPLRGRCVVLVPDNDQPGRDAMAGLRDSLLAMGCAVEVAYPEDSLPKGWDLADAKDAGWTADVAGKWLAGRIEAQKVVAAQESEPEPAPALADLLVDDVPVDDEDVADAKSEYLRQFTDIGLMESFVQANGNAWKFIPETGKWFEWLGDRWHIDEIGAIQNAAIAHLKVVERKARGLNASQRKALRSAGAVKGIMALSKTATMIATPQSLMDANPWLLGVPGGVIDLKTGESKEAHPDQLVSKQCTVGPDRRPPERWLAFLNQVLLGRQDQIDFLQRFAGYALIGKLFEPGLAFLHGGGGNGKGVVLSVLMGIMGDYAVSADFATFADQEFGERHSTDIARLAGARLVITEEGRQDQKLNEGLIKKLTGGGKVTARFMHHDNFEFEFVAKIIVASNHKPALSSVGEDMRRRLNMVPFDYTVPEDERDQYLGEKLREEYPRILNWMIEGAMHWQEMDGLHAPESIKAVSRGFIASQDPIGEFLAECCIVGRGQEPLPAVYRVYKNWAERAGERALSRRQFQDRIGKQSGINFVNGGMGKAIDGLTLREAGGV